MNKIQMAHDMALELVKIKPSLSAWQIADRCFEYADAMQAEADKREDKTRPEVLEEWQPNWSQAPEGYDYFCVGGCSRNGYFCHIEPIIYKDHYWFAGEDAIEVKDHGYTGNWQDSLRKRPQ